MDGNKFSSDQVIAEMLEMGFEHSSIVEAIKVVGPSITSVVDHILNGASVGSRTNCEASSSTSTAINSKIHANNGEVLKKRTFRSSGQVRQSRILDHFQPTNDKVKESKKSHVAVDAVRNGEEHKEPFSQVVVDPCVMSGSVVVDSEDDLDIAYDWEKKAHIILQKHFGFSSLKSFQKKALNAWFAHKDCLVLAATGSGKSLCFQLPALLTGKVVVVISPLISLMHDQCLKLARHGISACFLGSGQPDNTVEQKAMRGMYSIIYVCPETILRLIIPLQELAESRGIALFAIDEVHCVSKWGHDFRPDYRRLSMLREKFNTSKLKSLKFDIPLMALTATATKKVREDILKSLCLSKDTNVVLTSFFRSNLRFTVKHSRKSLASYDKDFHELIEIYGRKQYTDENKRDIMSKDSDNVSNSDTDGDSPYDKDDNQDDYADRDINVADSGTRENIRKGKELSVEFLENDIDDFQSVDDWDVTCGEFCAQPPPNEWESSEIIDPPKKPGGRLRILKEPVQKGPTIIYVPTRKETVKIANYLCKFGVKAAAYNAGLPKSHLRRVHKEFHQNNLEVVVATIAFGMGIDKPNVRRIIHYGWPQSLEAYYQEAGRAGRDGKLADCILYTNLARIPSLLPSSRSEDQTKQAYIMLSDCFRYGMNTSCCRAKILVEYFGEDFGCQKCQLCDVCVDGPPESQNLKEEASILLQTIAAEYMLVFQARSYSMDDPYDDSIYFDSENRRFGERSSLKMFVGKINEQSPKFLTTAILWWRGLARILEVKGYIREGDEKTHVLIKYPEPTKLGLEFVKSVTEQDFYVYPEADMLLAKETANKPYSSFSEWKKGWADPEIRRQRLEQRQIKKTTKFRKPRKKRKRNADKVQPDLRTSRGRLSAKLAKK
ncbi:PREDICTED: ATP-dependent DNA helicase Q-like SIM isoform X1 [Lupinus angustifolius]|uniref:ATP-dependent DNA helicase Q-like SIM isoform X1 n=1 Tax=Lupinus angustifolius TaxID=3871 RepID=UPI00092FA34A|nr:PREDICTED: ATP-dependent DNA helicase Q-like SIM isoform X1 [Lupinus angustifolius]XP_019452259.1 PREDICTED: ATP-dependent DNA helicase Q-like SIM isoform X1 [Lupinus angustifolius]